MFSKVQTPNPKEGRAGRGEAAAVGRARGDRGAAQEGRGAARRCGRRAGAPRAPPRLPGNARGPILKRRNYMKFYPQRLPLICTLDSTFELPRYLPYSGRTEAKLRKFGEFSLICQ